MIDPSGAKPYQTKEEYVYEVLRNAIMDGSLRPGDELVIDNLRDELGVSTIPIRIVLQRLEVEGLVNIRPHTGAVVSNISLTDVAEIFTLLEALESITFRAASQKVTDGVLKNFETIVKEMDAAAKAEDPSNLGSSELNIVATGISMILVLLFFPAGVIGTLKERGRLPSFLDWE